MSDWLIRPLSGEAELAACVRLQETTWGPDFEERVPATILRIAQRVGGIASGAFADGGELVGFVFGITGLDDGRLVHWSDMLAVRPDARGSGLGDALKRHQRAVLLGLGVETVLWTFDPLEARNARLNLSRLGATAGEYLRDYYGESGSPLHRGLGTDRLLVHWAIDSSRVRNRLDGYTSAPFEVVGLNAVLDADIRDGVPWPCDVRAVPSEARITIAVPAEIQSLKAGDPGLARAWRAATRSAFEASFAAGYEAVELVREGVVARYLLEAATGT